MQSTDCLDKNVVKNPIVLLNIHQMSLAAWNLILCKQIHLSNILVKFECHDHGVKDK